MLFENITQAYDLSDASIEIILMLLWAFILGMLLWWLLKPSKYVVQKVVSASAIAGVTSYSTVKKENKNIKSSVYTSGEEGSEWGDEVKKIKKPKTEKDNLQMIEGVWPKIEKLMNKHGVRTFADVVDTDVSGLEDILLAGWPRYQVHSPTTWPDQARLAKDWKWWELEEYQWILSGGRASS